VSVLAAIRPDDWNFPLLLHVVGAMTLVGGLFAAAGTLGFARGDARLLRHGYWALLAAALPGWVLMRVGAQWIYTKEGWDDLPEGTEPTWLEIGGVTADLGAPILLVALIAGGVGVYRLRSGGGSALLRLTLALAVVLLAAYVVAVWAMAGKPS
jgi:hypothetical protein